MYVCAVSVVVGTDKLLAVISGTCLGVEKPVGRVFTRVPGKERPGNRNNREQLRRGYGPALSRTLLFLHFYRQMRIPRFAVVDAERSRDRNLVVLAALKRVLGAGRKGEWSRA